MILYGSSVLDSTLTTASKMSTTTGGSETSKTTVLTLSGSAHPYGEIRSQGSAGLPTVASMPGVPSGHGWVYAPGAGTFAPGNWSASVTLAGVYAPISTTIRFFKYAGGSYTSIGTITHAGGSVAKTTYAYSSTALSAVTFLATDLLYVDLWWYDNANSAENDNPVVYESSSALAGVANDLAVTTSTFTPVGSTVFRWGMGRARLALTGTASARTGKGRSRLAIPRSRVGMGRARILPAATSSGLSLSVGGITMPVRLGSIQISDKRLGRSPASFVVLDPDGLTYPITERMRVLISTTALGTLFTGYVAAVSHEKAPGASTLVAKTVTCVDESYLPGKRYDTSPDSQVPQPAGDLVCDLVHDYLSAEGVGAPVARRRDTAASGTFGQGTLSGTMQVADGLTLSPAGSTVSVHETSTADFTNGILAGVTAASGALTLTPYTALRITGTAMTAGGGNLLSYVKIWNGSLTINSGDTLSYEIYVSTTSPEIRGGIDLLFSDNTSIRDSGAQDALGVAAHPNTSLNGFADDTWYHRDIDLAERVGKTVKGATIGLEAEKDGDYTYYVKNVTIKTSGGTVRTTLFGASLNANQQIANAGYLNVHLAVVTAYATPGTRVSAPYSFTDVGIIADSLLSWVATAPTQAAGVAGSTPPAAVLIETSFDNQATWQRCTNHAAIPGLPPGLSTATTWVSVRQTLTPGGPSPEVTPSLLDCILTVTSAPAASKSDLVDIDADAGTLTAGTVSNVEYVTAAPLTGLRLAGAYRNWDDGNYGAQTMYTTTPNGGVVDVESGGCLHLRCDSSNDVRTRFDFAGQWQDFVAEYDVLWDTNSNHNSGLIYRTTHWENANLTYAFVLEMSNTGIQLHYCSNSSSTGTNVTVATGAATWVVGAWYHIKVVVAGTSHQVYVNDYLSINATTSQFNQSGYLGMRYYNNTGARAGGTFDNFGVQSAAMSGTRTTNALALSGVGTVGSSLIQWNALLPGSSALDVSASLDGGATYSACTNGAQIPGLSPGTNVAGLSLTLRQTLSSGNANMTPYLTGCSAFVVGAFAAAGTRVSPPLPLALAGVCGSSSLTWDADIPAECSAVFATSTDGAAWSTVASSGDPIAALLSEGQPIIDEYATNTSARYTSTFYTGGSVTTPTFNTGGSQLQLAGGTNALYVWNDVTGVDVTVSAIVEQAEQGGLLLRYTTTDNWYSVILRDDHALSGQQSVTGIKRVAGTNTTYQAALPIAFARGTYHLATFKVRGTTLSFTWDGVVIFSVTDASLSASGKTGYCNLSGTAYYHRVRAHALGQDVTATSAYSKVTLTSSNPRVQPTVRALTETVRNPLIQSGALIPATNYQYQKTLAAVLDDLAAQSIGWWNINALRQLTFLLDVTTLAPFILTSADLLGSTSPRIVFASPTYCNRQYVLGGKDLVPTVESRVGNNYTLAWPMTYPIESVQSITLNNAAMLVGIRGTDTGKDFYYVQGDKILSQEIAALPLTPDDILVITYTGQVDAQAMSENTAQQAIIAALDNSSGIVESVLTVANLTTAACQTLADAKIVQNAKLARTWSFSTRRTGLASGQELTVFVPEHALMDVSFVITSVTITLSEEAGVVAAIYDVSVTDGPDVGHWGQTFIT